MCSNWNIDVCSSVPLCGATWLKSLSCVFFFLCPLLCARGGGWLRWPVCPLCSRSQSWSPVPAGQPARIHHFEAHCAPQATRDTLPCTQCAIWGATSYSPRTRHFAHCEAPRTQKWALQNATQDTGYTLGLSFSPKIHHSALQTTKDTPLGIFTGKYMYVYPITLYQLIQQHI